MYFAHIIRTSIPDKHFVGRYGGDEFLIIHHSLDEQELKKIKQELTQEFQKLDMPYSLTVSIGYSCGNVYSEETIKKVFQEADKNMYKQ